MSENLIETYNQAEYHIDNFEKPIKIGQINKDVESLLDQNGFDTWCFITAWNPMSEELPLAENLQRNNQLKKDLAKYKIIEGEGRDPKGRWKPEKSFLVVGISKDDAIRLAAKYNQAAIVFGKKEKPAELLITNEINPKHFRPLRY